MNKIEKFIELNTSKIIIFGFSMANIFFYYQTQRSVINLLLFLSIALLYLIEVDKFAKIYLTTNFLFIFIAFNVNIENLSLTFFMYNLMYFIFILGYLIGLYVSKKEEKDNETI